MDKYDIYIQYLKAKGISRRTLKQAEDAIAILKLPLSQTNEPSTKPKIERKPFTQEEKDQIADLLTLPDLTIKDIGEMIDRPYQSVLSLVLRGKVIDPFNRRGSVDAPAERGEKDLPSQPKISLAKGLFKNG